MMLLLPRNPCKQRTDLKWKTANRKLYSPTHDGPRRKHNDPQLLEAGLSLAAIAIKNDRDSRSIPMTEPAEPRRLPAPWRVIEHAESLVVEDAMAGPWLTVRGIMS
jgi:hypothetical protein